MTDQAIRYGAFFKCSGEKIIETTKEVPDGCYCSKGHHATITANYCPTCGSPCKPATKIVTKTEEFSPCFWEDDELLHVEVKKHGNHVYYYTNIDETTWRGIDADGHESTFSELPDLVTLRTNLETNPRCQEFFDRLHQKYEDVEIVTGMLVDCD